MECTKRNTPRSSRLGSLLGGAALSILTAACGGGSGGSGGGHAPPATLGALTRTGSLAWVALGDASLTLRTGPGPAGYNAIECVALDPANGVLYGVAYASDPGWPVLLRIDPTPGSKGLAKAPTVVAELAVGPASLAWHPTERMLYGVELLGTQPLSPARLWRIDPDTGACEIVGPCARVTTLELDPATGYLYGVHAATFRRIDPASGASLDLFQETLYLPKSTGLALDPLTGLFYAPYHNAATPPGIVAVDLVGLVGAPVALTQPLDDLVLDPGTGWMIGLTTGHGLISIEPDGGGYSTKQLGNLGCAVLALAYDPADECFFGVDYARNLVKLAPQGGCRTIGPLGRNVRTIVYDHELHELWGIDLDTNESIAIDPLTAEVTQAPAGMTLSTGMQLAIEPETGTIRGYTGGNQLTWLVDPHLATKAVSANAQGLPMVAGLTWDSVAERLLAAWSDSSGDWRISSWNPNTSGQAVVETPLPLDCSLAALERDFETGKLYGFHGGAVGGGQDLLEIDLDQLHPGRTVGSVRDRNYRATVYIAEKARIYAIDWDDVYSIDPATGATEWVGPLPSSGNVTGITWRADLQQLGLLRGGELLWTSPSAPWIASKTTALPGTSITKIAFSPDKGVYYGVRNGNLVSIALNETSAAIVTISSASMAVDAADAVWKDGSLWVATKDSRLFEVDPDTGVWTERGALRIGLSGLY